MKSTGIVRKIDNLGRVVIPKEIRNNMHIKVGDALEIYIDNNENIILKKFSNIGHISILANDIAYSINSIIKENVIITDNEKVVASSGNFKYLINQEISSSFYKLLMDRKQVLEKDIGTLFVTRNHIECSYAFAPILVNGELLGSIVLLSENRPIKEAEYDIVRVIASFFTKYLEE